MADGKFRDLTDDEIIAQIREIQAELSKLGVAREGMRLSGSPADRSAQLLEILESVREQLAARKRFLGVK